MRGLGLPQYSFNRILLDAIEEGLASLGDSPREAIFYHLEASFQLKKEDIPSNLTEFKQALEKIFGPGAPYIEKIITRQLCEKIGLQLEDPESADLLVIADDARKWALLGKEVR